MAKLCSRSTSLRSIWAFTAKRQFVPDDAAFGTLGETGKNNGYCAGSNKVCSDPLEGIATVTVTTKVGPAKISNKFNIILQ